MKQYTIEHPVSIQGVSLHSGNQTTIKLLPAKPNTGIKFFLSCDNHRKTLQLSAHSVIDTTLSTNIGTGTCAVSTIEHLMSAFHALGIDNIEIDIQGDSIPILDGSAISYYHLLMSAGHKPQNGIRGYTSITEPLLVEDGDSYIIATPYDGLIIDMTIDFDHPVIGAQSYTFDMDNQDYGTEIAPARTFGILSDIHRAIDAGLLKGGSPDNAIILDHESIINTKLLFPNEFVRHKILDFIGDIYVNGPIKGRFECCCCGHKLNNQFMRELHK